MQAREAARRAGLHVLEADAVAGLAAESALSLAGKLDSLHALSRACAPCLVLVRRLRLPKEGQKAAAKALAWAAALKRMARGGSRGTMVAVVCTCETEEDVPAALSGPPSASPFTLSTLAPSARFVSQQVLFVSPLRCLLLCWHLTLCLSPSQSSSATPSACGRRMRYNARPC